MLDEDIVVDKIFALKKFDGLVYLCRSLSSTYWSCAAKTLFISPRALLVSVDLQAYTDFMSKEDCLSLFLLGYSYQAYLQVHQESERWEKAAVYLEAKKIVNSNLELNFSIGDLSPSLSTFLTRLAK